MTKFLTALALSFWLALWPFGVVCAGPLEDAQDAARHGDMQTAIQLLEPLAEKGDVNAQLMLGIVLTKVVPPDWERANTWFHRAADQGQPIAEYFLALIDLGGLGTPKDESNGRQWALRSAGAGYAKAQTMAGAFFELGYAGEPKDYGKAMSWYEKAARQNDSAAQFAMGRLYENGQGVTKNYTQAAVWYRASIASALSGAPGATLSLGRLYEYGYGVDRDPVKALTLYCLTLHSDKITGSLLEDAEKKSAEISHSMTAGQISEADRRCELRKFD